MLRQKLFLFDIVGECMRKKIYSNLVIILFCLLNLSGCGTKKKVNVNNVDKYNVHLIEQYDSDTQPYWNTFYHNAACGNEGYYYGSFGFLYFYDMGTHESYPVCSKANCQHKEHTGCEADFCSEDADIKWVDLNIYYYKDNLYVISDDGDIVRVSTDGHKKEIVVKNVFQPTDLVGQCLTFSGNYVYAYNMNEHFVTEGVYTEKITRCNLTDGSKDVIYEYKGEKSAICALKSYGNQLFFVIEVYEKVENDDAELWTRNSKGLYVYNEDSGEIGKILDGNIVDYTVNVNDNCIYYFVKNDGIYKYNIESEEDIKIIDSKEYAISYGNISSDEQYIYIDNSWASGKTQGEIYVFNKEGCNVNVISRKGCHGWALFGDEQYMIHIYGDDDGKEKIQYIEKKKAVDEWEWIR